MFRKWQNKTRHWQIRCIVLARLRCRGRMRERSHGVTLFISRCRRVVVGIPPVWVAVSSPLLVEVAQLAQQAVGAAQQLRVRAPRRAQRAQLRDQHAALLERARVRARALRLSGALVVAEDRQLNWYYFIHLLNHSFCHVLNILTGLNWRFVLRWRLLLFTFTQLSSHNTLKSRHMFEVEWLASTTNPFINIKNGFKLNQHLKVEISSM